MDTIGRRTVLRGLAAAAAASTAASILPAFGQDRTSIRIGYAISKTGPNAAGAGITTTPNYLLWLDDVKKAGGITLSKLGKQLPIEVIEYDDRSTSEELVRAIERLATQDEVDFILAPWGTGFNLAAAPPVSRRDRSTGNPIPAHRRVVADRFRPCIRNDRGVRAGGRVRHGHPRPR